MDDELSHWPPSSPDVTEGQWNSVEDCNGVEYSSELDTYRASFDSTSESVSLAVVSTVAAVAETDPKDLRPLYSVVDTDALETLVESRRLRQSRTDKHVSFTFEGYRVTVHSYGIVSVRPTSIKNDT